MIKQRRDWEVWKKNLKHAPVYHYGLLLCCCAPERCGSHGTSLFWSRPQAPCCVISRWLQCSWGQKFSFLKRVSFIFHPRDVCLVIFLCPLGGFRGGLSFRTVLNQNADSEIPVMVTDWLMMKERCNWLRPGVYILSKYVIRYFAFHIFGFSVQIMYNQLAALSWSRIIFEI